MYKPKKTYEVIPNDCWVHASGCTVSVHHERPWPQTSESEWNRVQIGWTLRNLANGRLKRIWEPFETYADACQYLLLASPPTN